MRDAFRVVFGLDKLVQEADLKAPEIFEALLPSLTQQERELVVANAKFQVGEVRDVEEEEFDNGDSVKRLIDMGLTESSLDVKPHLVVQQRPFPV